MNATKILLFVIVGLICFGCGSKADQSKKVVDTIAELCQTWQMKQESTLNVIESKWEFSEDGHVKREDTFNCLGTIDYLEDENEWTLLDNEILIIKDEINNVQERYKMIDLSEDVLVLEKQGLRPTRLTLRST